MRRLEEEEEIIMATSPAPPLLGSDLELSEAAASVRTSPDMVVDSNGASPSSEDRSPQMSDLEPFDEYATRIKATNPHLPLQSP